MGAVSPLPALAARASVLRAPPLCPQTPSPTTPTVINPHLRAPQLRGCSTPSAEHSWLTPPECLLHCRQQGPAGPAALCVARHWARQGHRSSGEFINTTLQYLVSSADSLERLGAERATCLLKGTGGSHRQSDHCILILQQGAHSSLPSALLQHWDQGRNTRETKQTGNALPFETCTPGTQGCADHRHTFATAVFSTA